MRGMLSIFLGVIAIAGVALAVSGESMPGGRVVNAEEMICVVGGGNCQVCLNYCGGSGCESSRCADDGSDEGEVCGSQSGTGSAWTCGAWGSSSSNCTLGTANASCKGSKCSCNATGGCFGDTEATHSGRDNCSD